jgi:predicted DsbA family dithiol-disulfide isomerase
MSEGGLTTGQEPVVIHFDPGCPWTWRTSLWLRAVRKSRPLSITWRFFSLAKNRDEDWVGGRSGLALQSLALARRRHGNDAVDELYLALGRARHDRQEDLQDPAVVDAAVAQVGLPAGLRAEAVADPSIRQEVEADHDLAKERYKAFGSPLIVLDGGEGPAVFGPVLGTVIDEADAGEFWDRWVWLVRRPEFFEMKRPR